MTDQERIIGAHIEIKGIVQGVGFRPFVYGLATRGNLRGWVRNTSAGVEIEVSGPPQTIDGFIEALQNETPPLALINSFQTKVIPPGGYQQFEIIHSQVIPDAFQPISPDVSICPDCLRELFDPEDRRFRYPFINCTNCGPRFTIIKDIPYDRPKTTMADFSMCSECASEYANPDDRRYHAQPIACPVCGPQVWLEIGGEVICTRDAAILEAQKMLLEGAIVAIKGLGGFHLACDATNPDAVQELRKRKLRVDKPYAVMMPDIKTIEAHCRVNLAEQRLLESRQRPIVLLTKKAASNVAVQVAPGQNTLGVMLPYTPLHYLLFSSPTAPKQKEPYSSPSPCVLVMTSGNLSEEPIATNNEEARQKLTSLTDAFLMHDRPIQVRCDDSVVRVYSGTTSPHHFPEHSVEPATTYPIRRSRGYSPYPIRLGWSAANVLAVGAELKNTFCITRDNYAFLSHHIGDMENYETLQSFEQGIDHFERLFRIKPVALACDMHPDYLATRYAVERAGQEDLSLQAVQHHHAHIAACMAEHCWPAEQPIIGVAFDGTGYGDDRAIWGGEFLVCTYTQYERAFHLRYIPLPGGEKAIREPWRMALSWLQKAGIDWDERIPTMKYATNLGLNAPQFITGIQRQVQTGLNSPPTSSIGRLFDAAASIIGIRHTVNYEAQAAIEMEALVNASETDAYPIFIDPNSPEIDPSEMIRAVVEDIRKSVPVSTIAARFHNSIAEMVLGACELIRLRKGITDIALSGGVWQNITLLDRSIRLLKDHHFNIYIHRLVAANDSGLALGQVAVATQRLRDAG